MREVVDGELHWFNVSQRCWCVEKWEIWMIRKVGFGYVLRTE